MAAAAVLGNHRRGVQKLPQLFRNSDFIISGELKRTLS